MKNRGPPKWFVELEAARKRKEEDAYCNELLSKWMDAEVFISTVEIHHLEAGKSFGEIKPFRDELKSAIKAAYAGGEPWVRFRESSSGLLAFWKAQGSHPPGAYIGTLLLDLNPRDGALWLLSQPLYRHLVPPHWARVVRPDAKLTPEATSDAAKPAKPAKPGPLPIKRDLLKGEMRNEDPNRLSAMKDKEMERAYSHVVGKASRDTYRNARREVLSELSEFLNSDKI